MPLSMSQLVLPVFEQGLGALAVVLRKAEQHATARRTEEAAFLQARLYPDMFPLVTQAQIACDFAKGAVSRLAGLEVPRWHDNEASLSSLRARIARTLDYVRSVPAQAVDGSEARPITVQLGAAEMHFVGLDYVVGFVLPNFYFHLTTAYDILRHNGVDIGKRDFIGEPREAPRG